MDIKMSDYLTSVSLAESVDPSVADRLVREFFLESMLNTRLNELSKGSLQKVGVIQALIAPKEVLLLDEPLSGQDSASQNVFIRKVNDLRSQGVTIFMSCHEKRLIDELSDREYTIDHGKLFLKDGSDKDTVYNIYVRKDDNLTPWPEMSDHANRYVIRAGRDELKNTVMKLYNEGWELAGIEEYI
jgi:ABC-type multidrug transport system ATPase subunit